MRLDECLRVINRRLRSAEQEVARRQRLGLQTRPWQHRVQELVETRQEIAALAAPKKSPEAAEDVRKPDRSSRKGRRSLPVPDPPRPSS
ncbi:MAG TPA: hypothetical protein VII86_11290 [Thermoanaerobaculia bacterium]